MYRYHALDMSGRIFNANINYEINESNVTYYIESRGGTKGSSQDRNPDYIPALEMLLAQQKAEKNILEDILVDSEPVKKKLRTAERRVHMSEFPFPIALSELISIEKLRLAIGNTSKNIGQKPGSRGGNVTRKLLLRFNCNSNISQLDVPISQKKDRFDTHSFVHSGPPPSKGRNAYKTATTSICYVYVFWLKGIKDKKRSALKIGYTSNLEVRHKRLNKELLKVLTGVEWVVHKSFSFSNPRDAYDREQELHGYFSQFRYKGEREIYDLNIDRFDDLMTDFK